MACFIVEAYDKDNDIFEDLAVISTLEEAEKLSQTFTELISKGFLTRPYEVWNNDLRHEPFDWIEVRHIDNNGNDYTILKANNPTEQYDRVAKQYNCLK